jgi:YVTN family beta-propeller protein
MVHGLGYAPDGKTLAVVSIGSNSVTLIDTSTNSMKGVVYVGRAPHEAFFTPDGGELWVTVRGEDYVSVIDPVVMRETRRVPLANGPGMTMFSPDGQYGFVCSSFTPELAVVEVQSHRVVKRLTQASPFCPNIAVSPENDEVWITLKDAGKVQVFRAKPPFDQIAVLETGPITNDVNFAKNRNGTFAYVTVRGLNQVKVYRRRGAHPELVTTIPVGPLPHGVWPSGDGTRVSVALENGGAVQAIDTMENRVIAHIPSGQTAQALAYVPNAVPDGSGTQNLLPLGEAAETTKVQLLGTDGASGPQATVAVNSLGFVDLRSATSTPPSRNWSWPRSTGATAGRRSGRARRSEPLSRSSPPTGHPTTSCSTTDISSRLLTGGVCSSHSTGRETAPRSPRAATTWYSSRLLTASPLGRTWSSPTASPERSKNRVGPRTGRRDSQSALTGRSISRTTRTGASGESSSRAEPRRRRSSPHPLPRPALTLRLLRFPFRRWGRRKASIRTPGPRRQAACRLPREQRLRRSHSATVSSTAKWAARRA